MAGGESAGVFCMEDTKVAIKRAWILIVCVVLAAGQVSEAAQVGTQSCSLLYHAIYAL